MTFAVDWVLNNYLSIVVCVCVCVCACLKWLFLLVSHKLPTPLPTFKTRVFLLFVQTRRVSPACGRRSARTTPVPTALLTTLTHVLRVFFIFVSCFSVSLEIINQSINSPLRADSLSVANAIPALWKTCSQDNARAYRIACSPCFSFLGLVFQSVLR